MYKSEFLHEPSNFRKLCSCGLTVPWPFSNREWYVQVAGMCRLEDNAVVMIMKSLQGNVFMDQYTVEKNEKCVEVQIHYMAIYFEILEDNKQKIRMLCNIDPKFERLPDWLLNNSLKVVANAFLKQIAVRSEDPKATKDIILENAGFYD